MGTFDIDAQKVADIMNWIKSVSWTGPTAFCLALGWLLFLAVAYFWPSTYWLEVMSVRVMDSRVGQPIMMAVDRRIHANFHGTWVAQVRIERLDGDELFCPASGKQYYKRTSKLPDVLTLGWWTEGRCETLPPGRYIVETVWTIEPSAWPLPPKRVHVTSNPFEVSE